MLKFLSVAPLKGHRTMVLGGLFALQAVMSWLIGDITLLELWNQVPEIIGGLTVMTMRAALPEK